VLAFMRLPDPFPECSSFLEAAAQKFVQMQKNHWHVLEIRVIF